MKLALAVFGIAAAAAHRADADCGTPRWVGTPSGATIPARGVLYLHDEGTPRPLGGAIKTQTQVAPHVMRLEYATKAEELEIADPIDGRVFQVDPAWKPATDSPRVLQYWHHRTATADSVMLQIDQPTAAIRARWTAAGARAREWIVPAQSSELGASVVELGTPDCGSPTIGAAELARGGELTLTAIRFDGSEVPVTGLPPVLATQKLMATTEGLDRALVMPRNPAPAPMPAPALDIDLHFPFYMLIFGCFLLGFLFLMRVLKRSPKAVV